MLEDFYELNPYELDKDAKEKMLTKELLELTELHRQKCEPYGNMLAAQGYEKEKITSYYDLPFYPVRMFKEEELLSIDKEEIFKTMTSSGTTGQKVSKIYLDRDNAMAQQKVLIKILGDYLGKKRLPMLIIDSPEIVKNRQSFTARGAAIIGLRIAASKMTFALNEDMELDLDVVTEFLEKNAGKKFVIFGFTFLVWKHLYQAMKEKGKKLDLSNAYLFTGGGWKKIEAEKVSREEFKECFTKQFGITHFLDHYGMVEQTGCIYAECECGHLHASIYSDIIPRRYEDFSPCEIGEKGILQVVSVLPHSYPGHSLLTEDEGMILGEDDCPCGRKGKYVKIFGRVKNAELRGCSDVYASKF
ncbi:acyl protein synthase/acyl-CoA reductase RfbN [Lachnospiraceae bacterium KM106-2]|nr:acyl protein synthase/acyl-CoA reductase RfbN [Lachnospiraceae bacterium KM106-2]